MGYPDVKVTNATEHNLVGGVTYESIFCSNDTFSIGIGPGTSWSTSRGICLITSVYAVIDFRGTPIQATPYSSSGTSYSQFAVVQTGEKSFEVTRLVSAGDSAGDVEHVEVPEGTDPKTL